MSRPPALLPIAEALHEASPGCGGGGAMAASAPAGTAFGEPAPHARAVPLGRLLIPGRDGACLAFPITKEDIIIGRCVVGKGCGVRRRVSEAAVRGRFSAARAPRRVRRHPLSQPSPPARPLFLHSASPYDSPIPPPPSDPTCDIVLAPREISRRHARLQVRPGGRVWVSSLGREPVAICGVPVQPGGAPVLLPPGAALQVKLAASVREIRYEAPEVTTGSAPGAPRTVLGELQVPAGAGMSRLAVAASPRVAAGKPVVAAAPAPAPPAAEEMEVGNDQENAPGALVPAPPAAAKRRPAPAPPAPAPPAPAPSPPRPAPPRKSVRFAATPAGAAAGGGDGGGIDPAGTPVSGHPAPASVEGGAGRHGGGSAPVLDVRGEDTAAFQAWARGDGPGTAPPAAAPQSVGSKRASCSGSRLGTPAVRSGGGGREEEGGAAAAPGGGGRSGRRRSSTRAAAAAAAAAITLAAEEVADAAVDEDPAPAILALPAPPLAAAVPSQVVVRTLRLSTADATVELPASLFASPAGGGGSGTGTVAIVVPAALTAAGDVEIRIPAVSCFFFSQK
jgi:hypothetical protein